MKKLQIAILVAVCFLVIQAKGAVRISSIQINIYSPAADTGSSITFGPLDYSFSSPDIHFGLDQGGGQPLYWNPVPGVTDHDNHVTWGAKIDGSLTMDTPGICAIGLTSDDGSYLFVNGSLLINNGGDHGTYGVTQQISLNAGNTPFELEYWENGIGGSGVWMSASVMPEPESSKLIASALSLLFGARALRNLCKSRTA
jgi:hypothetical protein